MIHLQKMELVQLIDKVTNRSLSVSNQTVSIIHLSYLSRFSRSESLTYNDIEEWERNGMRLMKLPKGYFVSWQERKAYRRTCGTAAAITFDAFSNLSFSSCFFSLCQVPACGVPLVQGSFSYILHRASNQ